MLDEKELSRWLTEEVRKWDAETNHLVETGERVKFDLVDDIVRVDCANPCIIKQLPTLKYGQCGVATVYYDKESQTYRAAITPPFDYADLGLGGGDDGGNNVVALRGDKAALNGRAQASSPGTGGTTISVSPG